jgi:putative transposase
VPRKPRFNLVGLPQHLIQRGNNREPCFYAEEDYQRYLRDLYESALKYDCRIHAYILMTNHVHLLVTPMGAYGVSQMMQALGRRYVYYINNTYKRTGTLWEGRYKSSLIDSDNYLLTCMRYIELNPIRATLVEHPGDYKWSSYHANAQGNNDPIIESHPLYIALGQTAEKRQQAYRELFRSHVEDDLLHEIRDALNHELVFGRSHFKDRIEEITQRQVRLGRSGRPSVKEERGIYLIGY